VAVTLARPHHLPISIAPVTGTDIPALAEFEVTQRLFPARREGFLQAWIAVPHSVNLLARVDNELVGWIGVRPSPNGWRVGPLFALTSTTASALLQHAVTLISTDLSEPSLQLFIDVPEPNTNAIELVEQLGMSRTFQCVRMYKGADPDLQLAAIFGNTTFELG
jgi:hypothetical protein